MHTPSIQGNLHANPVRVLALTGLAWLLGLVICLTATSCVQAANVEPIEEVLVTGSHIKRTEYNQSSPLQSIDRDGFQRLGASTLLDGIKFLPVNTGSVLTQETGGLIGTSQINIRGLGPGSTLTLINGKRAGVAASTDGNGGQFFDINQLPLAMIERVDIQTDGASAIYGSEAVAGVANIITRSGFEGLELSAKSVNASNETYALNLASGHKTVWYGVNLYATEYHQTRNDRTDFRWLRQRIDGNGDRARSSLTSGSGAPGTYQAAQIDPESGAYLADLGPLLADPDCEAAGGILSGGRCRHSFADQVSVIPEENRRQIFTEAHVYITPGVRGYAEFGTSRNQLSLTRGPTLFRNGLADGNMFIPGSHPFNFYAVNEQDQVSYIGPEAWDNDLHIGANLTCHCRPLGVEFNGHGSQFDHSIHLDYRRSLWGVEADLSDSWSINISNMTAQARKRERIPYQYVAAELNAALTAGTHNPFGTRNAHPTLVSPKDGTSVAAFNSHDFDNWHHISQSRSVAKQSVIDAVFTGDLYETNTLSVALALGAQRRIQEFEHQEDALDAQGLASTPEVRDARIAGDTKTHALFVETSLAWHDQFVLNVALRNESYRGDIGSTLDPKLAFHWSLTETLGLRGSYGTSFQAPTVQQTNISTSTAFIDDPASLDMNNNLKCQDTGLASNTTVLVNGEEGLDPQSARNNNVGFVWSPTKKIQASFDYWRFDYGNLIRPDTSAQALVNADCLDDGVPNDPRIIRSRSGQIRSVSTSFVNTGRVLTDGFDINVNYTMDPVFNGILSLALRAAYVNQFSIWSNDTTGEERVVDGAGQRNFNNPFSSIPKLRANLRASWARNNHSAHAALHYIDSYINDQNIQAPSKIDAWWSFDIHYGFAFAYTPVASVFVNLGVNNVFNTDPPSLGLGVRPGYDAHVHDVQGRQTYLELKAVLSSRK